MRVFISTSFALILCINLSFGQIRNIVLNEFMFDPIPSSGLPETEYVEIMNITDEPLHLEGWYLNDHLIPDVTIMPGDFLVLCKSSETQFFNQTVSVAGMLSWDILNNTGQSIILSDNNSVIVDSLMYDNSWISDKEKSTGGWSLELINPLKPCSGKDNWAVSENLNGGTPGFNNSVFDLSQDIIQPKIARSTVSDDHSLQIWFNEAIDFNKNDLTLSFIILEESIKPGFLFTGYSDIQQLTFPDPLDPGKEYRIQVKNLSDCSGNYIRDTLIYFGIGLEPGFNDVLITEILVDETPSVGLPESEYIEILNATDQLISIKNSYLYTNSKFYMLPEHNLSPGEYYILIPGTKAELFRNFYKVLAMNSFPRLNNDGKDLAIYNRVNGTVFSIQYDKNWYKYSDKSNGGYSLEMIDTGNPCGNINNWTASESGSGGTPGEINSVHSDNPDLTRPVILSAHALEKERITVLFNEKLHANCFHDLEVFVNNQNMKGLWTYDTINFNSLEISYPDPPDGILRYELSLTGIKDCVGNFMKHEGNPIQISVPSDPTPGDVVINEILFNPKPGGTDWIEIYNRSEKHLDLKNWYISAEIFPTEEQKNVIVKDHYVLNPFSFLVLTENIRKVIRDFPNAKSEHCLEISKIPELPDQGGYISILSLKDVKLDEMHYKDEQHNLFLMNADGISLERISPDIPTNDLKNWHSASSNSGYGTPTEINSQFRNGEGIANHIEIFPKVISPDQDGSDDMLHISLINLKPGYFTNIYIYNIRGILLRTLVKGRLLGVIEDITWDGFINNGDIADPGHYILLFELFHPDGDMFIEKMNFVIAQRF